jgi:hypothetical protein
MGRYRTLCLVGLLAAVVVSAGACSGKAQVTETTARWTGVGISRVMSLELRPGHPFAVDFQVSSPDLRIFVLTQKPLAKHVLLLRSPGAAGSSEDKLTVVPMHTWTRSLAGHDYILTAKAVKPGPYRFVLIGEGEVFTVQFSQR